MTSKHAMAARRDDANAAEAYAFLKVLAPKLEQLRRRLADANELLGREDEPASRLNAIIESQLALKEFVGGLANMSGLVAPLDVLLALLNEEEAPAEPPAPAEQPKPAPASDAPSADGWLRVGTMIAVERLLEAGVPEEKAVQRVERAFGEVNLTLPSGAPITVKLIKNWSAPKGGGWRKKLKSQPSAPRSPTAVADAQRRVAKLAEIFKRMSTERV